MAKYTSKLIPTKIAATSRVSIKLRDTFYTFEYMEERKIPSKELNKIDIEQERKMLWEECHAEVDAQVEEIIKAEQKLV